MSVEKPVEIVPQLGKEHGLLSVGRLDAVRVRSVRETGCAMKGNLCVAVVEQSDHQDYECRESQCPPTED